MRVVIARVDETLFEGEAMSLVVPAAGGVMTVLGHHMPLVTTLKKGQLTVHVTDAETKEFPVDGGVLEVRADGATVIL